MKYKHLLDYNMINSGEFTIEAISAAHRLVTPPNNYIRYANEHKHDRIIFIKSGSILLDMFDQKPIEASVGDCVYIPNNIAYKAEWKSQSKGELYSINYIMLDKGGYQITISPGIFKSSMQDGFLMEGLFQECASAFLSGAEGYMLKCKYLFMKLLYTLASLELSKKKSKISKALVYLNCNYQTEIPVSELAKMCNLGECMFRRSFKQETGMSPLKYKNKLRIEKAYELLTLGTYSVNEVMELTGFFDASYFNKTFKAYTNRSPSQCKRKDKIST